MKIDRQKIRHDIEDIISVGCFTGEEVDVTTDKMMDYLKHLFIIAENHDPKTHKDTI